MSTEPELSPLRKWAAATDKGADPMSNAIREVRVCGTVVTMCLHSVIQKPTPTDVQDAIDAATDLIGALRTLKDVLP